MGLKFTDEEFCKIVVTFKSALKDLKEFYDTAPLKEIAFGSNVFDSEKKSFDILRINQSGVFLKTEQIGYFYNDGSVRCKCPAVDVMFNFLKNYDSIKEMAIDTCRKSAEIKNEGMDVVDRLSEKFKNEASVEINFPETMNQHEIEVSEVDGKKVGVINFGNQTIRIITNGDIVLVNKDECIDNPPVKKK